MAPSPTTITGKPSRAYEIVELFVAWHFSRTPSLSTTRSAALLLSELPTPAGLKEVNDSIQSPGQDYAAVSITCFVLLLASMVQPLTPFPGRPASRAKKKDRQDRNPVGPHASDRIKVLFPAYAGVLHLEASVITAQTFLKVRRAKGCNADPFPRIVTPLPRGIAHERKPVHSLDDNPS